MALAGVGGALWFLVEAITTGQVLAAVFLLWVATGGWRTLRMIYRTGPRELM